MEKKIIFNFLFNKIFAKVFLFHLVIPLVLTSNNKAVNNTYIKNEVYMNIGNSNMKILNERFSPVPFQVLLNGNEVSIQDNIIINPRSVYGSNLITLRWNMTIEDCSFMFYDVPYVTFINLTNFDLSLVTNTEMMFGNCISLNKIIFPKHISNTSIQDMNHMFYECRVLNYINIENLNTFNVKNMSYMFYGCNSLNSLNLSNFDTTNLEAMQYMFYNCKSIKILNLSSFDISKVTNIDSIFEGCTSLMSLDLSGLQFNNVSLSNDIFSSLSNLIYLYFSNITINNEYNNITSKLFSNNKNLEYLDISNFRAKSIINLENMFRTLNKLTYIDISNFQSNNALNMSGMFSYCTSLKSLNLSNFGSSLVYDMNNIFKQCTNLNVLDLSNFVFNNNYRINNIFSDLTKIQKIIMNNAIIYNDNISCLFKDLNSLKYIELENFNDKSVLDMSYLFYNCKNLISLNLSNFKMEKVINISYIFYQCEKLVSLDLSFLKTSNIEYMIFIFFGCSGLKFLDLSNWDFNNVKHAIDIFTGLSGIQYISLKNSNFSHVESMSKLFSYRKNLISIDLSNLDASYVINMDYIFGECINLISINLTNLTTFKVENMERMFYNCKLIKELDLSEINAKSVKNMRYMFSFCKSLISLNLTNFETENIENMEYMFYECNSIKSINLSHFKTSKVKDMTNIFYKCNSLISLDYSNFDFTSITHSLQILENNKETLQYIKASNINLSTFTNINGLFSSFNALKYIDLSYLDASSAISMRAIFYKCANLLSVNLNSIKINEMQDMGFAFVGCNKLMSINISNIDVSYVSNMGNMFQDCYELIYVDLSNLNLKGIISAYEMFMDCRKLREINFSSENKTFHFSNFGYMFYNCFELISLDLTSFNTDNVEYMHYMFKECKKLEMINLSSFNTTKTISMKYMFYNCYNLKTLDLSNFRTPNLKEIDLIFFGCVSLFYLDLSNLEFKNNIFSKSIFYNLKSLQTLKLSHVKTYKNMNNIFSELKYIISLDLSNFDTTNANNMHQMFWASDKLKFLNLTNINTSQITTMEEMFRGCTSLTSLDLSSFDTSKVNNIKFSFSNMFSLTYIKLNFNLKSLLSGYYSNSFFSTKNFEYCIIDESNMTVLYSLIKSLPNTRRDCSKKCYPDIRTLNNETNQCIHYCSENSINKYFYNFGCYDKCPPKTYLASNISDKRYICKDLYCEKYYDFNQNNCIDIIPEGYYLNDSFQKTIDKCHPNCKDCNGKEKVNNTNCKLCIPEKYFDYGNCIDNCSNGYYLSPNDASNKICKCINSSCLSCPLNNTNLCYSCNEPEYYQIYNDTNNIFPYVNCYKNPEGYYLDNIDKIYKPCYNTCKACSEFGDLENNNCLDCNDNYSKKDDFINDNNCYRNCPYYYYFDYDKKYFCTNDKQCPNIFNKVIEEKNKCVDSCEKDKKYKYEFKKKCYEKCPINTRNNNYFCEIECPEDFPYEKRETQQCVKNCSINDLEKQLCILNNKNSKTINEQDEIIKNIQESLLNGEINTSKIESGEDIVIKTKDTSFTITNTQNQKNGDNKNISTINLGECEKKLKSHYNISQSDSFYILKVDVLKEGMQIPKIEYEVYYPFNGKNLEKLSLKICEDIKIELSLPVTINLDDLEKHDSSSGYYNDICYISPSNNGTDISLNDRKNEFINNNLSICEENCHLNKYDPNTKKALCSCEIKTSLPKISEVSFDKQKLKNSFIDIKNIANIELMKCSGTLFSKLGLKNNYGFFILFLMIFGFFICMFLYYMKEHKNFKKIIKIIISYKMNQKQIKSINQNIKDTIEKNNNKIKFIKKQNNKTNNSSRNLFLNNNKNKLKNYKKMKYFKVAEKAEKIKFGPKTKNNNLENIINIININSENNSNKNKKKFNPPSKKNKKNNKKMKAKFSKDLIKNHQINQITNNNDLFLTEDLKGETKLMKKYEKLIKLTDSELNDLEYKDALKIDKRTYWDYYLSLIKTKHVISFTFLPLIDYNSRIIKLSLFILSSIIDLFVNALFFSDSTMHQIYEDNGSFNFIYQAPQIFYSYLISGFLYTIIQTLSLTENDILKIKQTIRKDKLYILEKKTLKIIFYKSVFYFLISFLILLFCWYYLSCFCCIYKNTQFHLFKDTLLGFIISLLTPFGINLVPGFFRIPALRTPKKNRRTMYKFSKIIQII